MLIFLLEHSRERIGEKNNQAQDDKKRKFDKSKKSLAIADNISNYVVIK